MHLLSFSPSIARIYWLTLFRTVILLTALEARKGMPAENLHVQHVLTACTVNLDAPFSRKSVMKLKTALLPCKKNPSQLKEAPHEVEFL